MKEMKKFLCKFSKLPYVDLVAGVRCGHPHVLARVVATDGGRDGAAGVGHGQGVRGAVPHQGAVSCSS